MPHEPAIRLACFFGVLLAMAAWEACAPRRRPAERKPPRWASNLGLAALNALAVRLVLTLGAVGVALVAEERSWGLLNRVELSAWVAVPLTVVALDFAIYLQHVAFHAVPILWRLHMVHHADLDFDVTTGVRFHTLEALLSMAIKAAAIVALGAPPLGVLAFEVLLSATSLFNHANARLPARLDRLLRLLVVTPDMHRVHHSVHPSETNSNYGFNLPWWDYLLGTYRAQPRDGHEGMAIGLAHLRDRRVRRLPDMLLLPFSGSTGGYPRNREDARKMELTTEARRGNSERMIDER